ncbi:hypothetical protein [Streptomyces sp. NPDC000410]|uniref:hypothetical protein n=1 Tax=Streptomyces sp. NPDC000410 TaxID=3154254 RepID=UPI003320AE8A
MTAVLLGLAGCGLTRPDVDPDQRRLVQPLVHDALIAQMKREGGMLTQDEKHLRPQWFCSEDIIEIAGADDGQSLTVGLLAVCQEYGKRGGALVTGTGMATPWITELRKDATGRYRVTSQDSPPDGGGYVTWIERHFSEAGAEHVRDGDQELSREVEAAARRHFGVAEDAPVEDL